MKEEKFDNTPNLVEMMTMGDDDCAFDQECVYGNRVGGHAVYCHNEDSPYRKCRFGWYSGGDTPDRDCQCFKENPNYKSPNPLT